MKSCLKYGTANIIKCNEASLHSYSGIKRGKRKYPSNTK